MTAPTSTYGPDHFINRELSWLEFNQRVLDQARDPNTPLLERLKFLCISSSNLDEFFEVRIAGLKQQVESPVVERSVDGRTASETLRAVLRRVRAMVDEQYLCWQKEIRPALAPHGLRLLDIGRLDRADLDWVEDYYRREVRPVLTPLAIDPAHPFPQLLNKSVNIIVQLELTRNGETLRHLAVVQLPRNLPRLIQLPRDDSRREFLRLGYIIGHHLHDLFPGTHILGFWHFRVTRNSELYIQEEEAANLLKAVEDELHNRRKGDAVRLEVDRDCPLDIRKALLGVMKLKEEDLFLIDGPMNMTRLMAIYDGDHSPELRDPPFVAPIHPALRDRRDLFEAIRERDILLHHPYDSFNSVVGFLENAADDPAVLAIKMTLYRTGGDRRIIDALMNAVRNGKQVTAVVELRARFDEANNIQWARRLEENGVHVVYGLVGYKIHCKMCLVVRKDTDAIRRYVHLGTGNYNASTARLYTDLGLLTCRPDIGEDATNLFNLLTGICQFQEPRKLLVAPFELHGRMLHCIRRETDHARRGLPARIIAKMNSLVDPEIIRALYDASQAGVHIDLIVRGICCLRPGLPGISERITVSSIVDRFLEHSRIFYFENALQPQLFVGSADWMPRNFFRRIEVLFPIEDGTLREKIRGEILSTVLVDNDRARVLGRDGVYRRPRRRAGQAVRRSQAEFIQMALSEEQSQPSRPTPKRKYVRVKLTPNPFKP